VMTVNFNSAGNGTRTKHVGESGISGRQRMDPMFSRGGDWSTVSLL
jgi:hypothetical protein